MTIFFQHVGEAGAKRDFPKTIGTNKDGEVHFSFDEISEFIEGYTDAELLELRARISSSAPNGFQVWGIPSGAKSILRNFSDGDYILLLETITQGGSFGYAGQAVQLLKGEQFRLSQKLWGEARFPLIILLNGGLTDFPWHRFCDEFGYKKNWNPAGNTYELKTDRILQSSFSDEIELIRAFLPKLSQEQAPENQTDFTLLDLAELDFSDEEGRRVLREHLARERSAGLVLEFKKHLAHWRCETCGFDFVETYGELGRGFIEAHHVKPLGELDHFKLSSPKDLIAVCSNCHRMLHRKFPAMTPEELKKILSSRMIDRIQA